MKQQKENSARWYEAHKAAHRERVYAWRRKNAAKVLEYSRRWRLANIERVRHLTRKSRGIPQPTRPRPELCECCGLPPTVRALAVDHDHKTGKFRGWLCSRCNAGIGFLGDNLSGLLKARRYLKRAAR